MKPYTDKQWLKDQLDIIGMTVNNMAHLAKCNERTIRRYLKKFDLSTRSMSENASFRQARQDAVSGYTIEIINGELLGDGNLSSDCAYSAKYRHSSKYQDYLVWLKSRLNLDIWGPVKNQTAWGIQSKSYTQLFPLFLDWYRNGKKEVPQNLTLTPLMCLHWYIGDGSLLYKTMCRISTYSFHIDSLYRLMEQLKDFSPRIHRNQSVQKIDGYGYRIALSSDFLDFIGPCPDEIKHIYGYKWEWSK